MDPSIRSPGKWRGRSMWPVTGPKSRRANSSYRSMGTLTMDPHSVHEPS